MAQESLVIIEEIEFILSIKSIKNLYIRVKKDGKAYVSIPKKLTKAQVQSTLLAHLPWVKAQKDKLSALPEIKENLYESGEIYHLWGKAYFLQIEDSHKGSQAIMRNDHIILQANADTTIEQRIKLLDNLYREELNLVIPQLMKKWEERIQVKVSQWRLKKMKTRWGTCNTQAKRIWLNTELAKYPSECLEYVLVHELVHLLERSHNHRFKAFMTEFLPDWPMRKKNLNNLAIKVC